jgi:hypothetical protein
MRLKDFRVQEYFHRFYKALIDSIPCMLQVLKFRANYMQHPLCRKCRNARHPGDESSLRCDYMKI